MATTTETRQLLDDADRLLHQLDDDLAVCAISVVPTAQAPAPSHHRTVVPEPRRVR